MSRTRLIFAIVSTIIEEAVFVIAVIWGLPQLGVHIPVWIMVVIMIVWAYYSIYTFRKGTKALKVGNIIGLTNMTGTKGKTVDTLNPEGWVKINGELWSAISLSGEIKPDTRVTVKGQKRLKLEVAEDPASTDEPDANQ